MNETYSIQERIAWSEDFTALCAGQAVIPAAHFEELAIELVAYTEVTKTKAEMIAIFKEQTKRFAACGANHSDKFGVLRKNKANGWKYIEDLITEK